MLAMSAYTLGPLPPAKIIKKASRPRGDSLSNSSVTSKELSFTEALKLTNTTSTSTTSLSAQSSGKLGKKTARTPSRPVTPPIISLPKAGPNTATKVQVRRVESSTTLSRPATASKTHGSKEAKVAEIRNALSSCLESCRRATKTGDTTSIHMMELLSSSEVITESLHELANAFLDNCRLVMDIEDGLKGYVKEGRLVNPQPMNELQSIIKSATAELKNLDSLVAKSLEHARKGTVGRKMKMPWGARASSDKDFHKMSRSLEKSRYELQDGIDGLNWTSNTHLIPNGKGFGFTGLAAALNRLDSATHPNYGAVLIASADSSSSSPAPSSPEPTNLTSFSPDSESPPERGHKRNSFSTDLRLNSAHGRPEVPTAPLPPLPPQRSPSLRNGNSGTSFIDSRYSSTTAGSSTQARYRSFMSTSAESAMTGDDSSLSLSHDSFDADDNVREPHTTQITSPSIVRIRVDPESVQHSRPNNVDDFARDHHQGTLISAIRSKKRKLVIQLLNKGVSPSAGPDSHPLNEAISIHDDSIVQQLLAFGADPNEPDLTDISPLHACMNVSHLPSAVNLLRYKADPHLMGGKYMQSPLCRAVTENLTGFMHVLLIYGGNVRHMTGLGETLLMAAINKQTPKKAVEMLLDYGADPNIQSRDGRTPLHKAVTVGRVDIVALLLDRGSNPNLPGPRHVLWDAVDRLGSLQVLLACGADPRRAPGVVQYATSRNSGDAVRMLLKAKADPDARNDVDTPLCTAIRDNRIDIFNLLVNIADPNLKGDEHPLTKCVMHHRAHFLPLLKAAGAILDAPKGLLETAVAFKNMEALRWLLDHELNPNEKSAKGHTALTTAIRDNRLDMVDLLLSRGADPNVRGHDWPLCLAVRHPPVLKRLLKSTAQPRAFKGVMEMAAACNQLESVKHLLKAGVSAEDKTAGVFSPLTTAIRENHCDIVYHLVNVAKADISNPGEHLPLVMAVQYQRGGDMEALELLLERGADPNTTHRGTNAAMAAIEKGDLAVLKLLCEASKGGVDWEIENIEGQTVLDAARSKGWDEAVSVLMRTPKRN